MLIFMHLKTLENIIEFNQLNSVSYIKSDNKINQNDRFQKHLSPTVSGLDEDLLISTVC